MDELNGHRSFAHGCGATFAGPGPDVPGGEDAGHTCLEQVVGAYGVACEDEAVGIARDGVVQPFRARLCTPEEEKGRERQQLAALQRDRLELPIAPWRAAISLRSRTTTPYRSSSWMR